MKTKPPAFRLAADVCLKPYRVFPTLLDQRSIRGIFFENRGPKNDPFSEGRAGDASGGTPPGGVRGGSKMAIFGLSLGVRNCANFGAKMPFLANLRGGPPHFLHFFCKKRTF